MRPAIKRSDLLNGDIHGRNRPIRPPWALDEMAFRNACNSCGDCLKKCPARIIEFGRGRLPRIDFAQGECLFCGDCAEACKTGALLRKTDQAAWRVRALIDEQRCLATRNIECRSCQDPCESRAIRFLAAVGSVSRPSLAADHCNGCGACFAVCPVKAIGMTVI